MYFKSNLNMWSNANRTSKLNCNNEIALTEYSSKIAQYKSNEFAKKQFSPKKIGTE